MSAPAKQDRKVVRQYRRARRLARALAGAYVDAVVEAESFSPEHWETVAGWITDRDGKPFRPPSPDTIALTIEILREKAEQL